jgi:hypothetical protein
MNAILDGLARSNLLKSCIVDQQRKFGTSYRIHMKGMIKSRRKNYKLIGDDLKISR